MPAPWDQQQNGPPAGTEGQIAKSQPGDFSFPVKGYDENWAYKAQPEGTTPDCLNVRPYDVIAQRLRGGSRPGLSKYVAGAINGANPIQRMGLVMRSVIGGSGTVTDPFTQANGQLAGTNWLRFTDDPADFTSLIASATYPIVNANHILADSAHTPPTTMMDQGAFHKTAAITCDEFTLSAKITLAVSGVNNSIAEFSLITSSPSGTFPVSNNDISAREAYIFMLRDWGGTLHIEYGMGSSFTDEPMTPGSGNYLDPAWWTTPRTLAIHSTNRGVLCTLSIEGHVLLTDSIHPTPTPITEINPGFRIIGVFHAGDIVTVDDWTLTNTNPISNRKPTIVVVSGGSVYTGDKNAGFAVATSGANVLSTFVEKVRMTDSIGKMYFADGTVYEKWDNTTNTVSTWTASAGTLPVSGTNTCRLIASYRGRIVLSGLVDDPQNWFMSAAGDPLDWDYGATVSAVMAVAGNNTVAGKCPDIITCLAPMGDDVMVIGGDHTIWLMRGDPADGGRIDNLSQQMGILGQDSYCVDPDGTLYFFGNGVLWKMSKPQPYQRQEPQPMSRGRLDKTFNAIDYSQNTVKLLWDETFHGVHIYIVPIASGATTHYWWDARTDGFWKDQYPASHGPVSVMIFDADAANDRTVLLGGWDSYIRQTDASARTDDGTTILSRVKFGPITPGGVHHNCKLNRIITRTDPGTDPFLLRVYAANSPDQVILATTPAWATTVDAVTPYAMPRITGNSLLFELMNDSFSAAWVTGHVYAVGSQVVAADGLPYICLVAHTSTNSGTDLHPTPPGNSTDWVVSTFRRWAIEGISVIMDVTGRTRHGRL